jgi:hypothetical protein
MSGTPANMAQQVLNLQFYKENESITSNITGSDAIAQVWFGTSNKFQSNFS